MTIPTEPTPVVSDNGLPPATGDPGADARRRTVYRVSAPGAAMTSLAISTCSTTGPIAVHPTANPHSLSCTRSQRTSRVHHSVRIEARNDVRRSVQAFESTNTCGNTCGPVQCAALPDIDDSVVSTRPPSRNDSTVRENCPFSRQRATTYQPRGREFRSITYGDDGINGAARCITLMISFTHILSVTLCRVSRTTWM